MIVGIVGVVACLIVAALLVRNARRQSAPASRAARPAPPARKPGVGPTVTLGNNAVVQVLRVPDDNGNIAPRPVPRPDLGQRVTSFGPFPSDWPLHEMLTALTKGWAHHSSEPPAWVEADDSALAEQAATAFGCPVGRPVHWKEGA